MEKKKLSIKKLFKSFGYAWNGIWLMISEEQNAKIHVLVSCLVIGAGFFFNLTHFEWIMVVIVIGCVLAAEAFNTAIEALSDLVSREYNPTIKRVKDLSAGAVLLVAIAAATVGILIFLPKALNLF